MPLSSRKPVLIYGRLRPRLDLRKVADICCKAGIRRATDFNWKQKSGGMLSPDMRRLKQPEDGTSKLRQLVADLCADKEMLQNAIRRKL